MSAGKRAATSASCSRAGSGEEVRSQSNRFAVAPGHVAPDVEAVVKESSHYWLVDKYGETGRIAENLR